ncbi:LPS export ABC transporter permease LptF [Rhodocyclus purpureus]|uniref:LPS export ABC transporter permease LptF n=1 Tax=Rhodocyclus purpureus TaxID=1067 RepID=UPI001911B956|nr:LPS export ABC transporter permease LptF [Rhodocyclus purpureus]MBK5912915.1 LPS export ABC transporter permease LptF [Rhodocyclus purpureus]
MIFHRAVRRELTHSAAGVFVALFAIMATTQLIRLLAEAAAGKVSPGAVVALLGFTALNYLPILLSLAMFVAILLTLSRCYRDSEMVVWFSSGLSLTAWVRPVLVFAAPLLFAIAVLSFFLSPWALSQSAEFRQKLSARADVSQVSPGAFQEARNAERVIFVEAVADDASLVRNVFVSSLQNQRLGVTMAATGRQETAANGDRFMVLENGRRYEVEPGTAEFRILEFDRYALRIETREAQGIERTPRYLSTRDLIRNPQPDNQAELLWRIGIPLSTVVLILLAIPLSFVNPRVGRSANLFLALCLYMIYSNLLSISQAWVAQGKLSFVLGTLSVHLLMLALLPILFYRRIAVTSILRR